VYVYVNKYYGVHSHIYQYYLMRNLTPIFFSFFSLSYFMLVEAHEDWRADVETMLALSGRIYD